jgi:hypothetical protein
MSIAVELRADAQRICTFALGVTASEVRAELHAMIQELEHRARLLDDSADARGRSS